MKDYIILIYSYLHGIWQYRWSALLISFVIAIVGWGVVYSLPNQYSAKAVMQVDTKSVMKPLLEGLSVESDVEAGLNLMSSILLSRKNIEDIIRQTDMDLAVSDPAAMDRLVEKVAKSITLKEDSEGKRRKKNNNNIYELSYQGESAELVYQVVSKLLNSLVESTLDSARTDTAAAQKFLDRQIADYERRLSAAEQSLADFKRANVGYMPDERGGYYTRLQAEQAELENIRSEIKLAKRKHAAMLKQLEGEAPLLDSQDYGSGKLLKLRRYREQLEELLTKYHEQHPDVQALRATIAEVLSDDNVEENLVLDSGAGESVEFNPVYQELKAEINRAKVDVETLKIKLNQQVASVEALKKAVDILPEVEAKLAKLNRDYEITRERYLSLVTRRESARLAQEVGMSGSNIKFRIIDAPRVPSKPSGPNRLLLLSAVFLFAVAAGLGWGFLRYMLQPTFIDSSQIENKIGLPILGSVGLYMTVEHKQLRKTQMTYFVMALFVLAASFAGVVIFKESGSALVGSLFVMRG